MKDLVIYNNNGLPESIKYDRISLYLAEIIKDQQMQIELQQEQIEELTNFICDDHPNEEFC